MTANMLRSRTTVVLLGFFLAVVSVDAQPRQRLSSKLDTKLAEKVRSGGTGATRVIIRTSSDGVPRLTNELKAKGRQIHKVHLTINALTVQLPVDELENVSELPFVESISTDAIVKVNQTSTTDSTLRGTLGLSSGSRTGYGVRIAMIDSGLEAGPEFGWRIDGFYDFTHSGIKTWPSDDYGHGTHVAGLIAGDGDLSTGRYRGVAPRARLTVFKVLDATGAGYTSDVIEAIEYVTKHKWQLGIDVINLSLGHPILEPAATDPLVQAVEAAVRSGIVVVAAAGNSGVSPATGQPGYAGVLSPGNAPSAITVGSVKSFDTTTRSDDRVATYSSRGPSWYDGEAKPDLVAPGHALVSVAAKASQLYLNNPALQVDNDYMRLSGTSMATGVVSGAVALVIEAHRAAFPNTPLPPNLVKSILQYTAVSVLNENSIAYHCLTQGAGSVNPAGAIELTSHIDTSMPLGSMWLTGSVDAWTAIDGQILPWAGAVTWGNALSEGPAPYFNELAWTQNIVWGSNIVWGNNIVWGSNIVWGNNIVWGSNIVWGNTMIGAKDGSAVSWGMSADTASSTAWGTLGGGLGSSSVVLTSQ